MSENKASQLQASHVKKPQVPASLLSKWQKLVDMSAQITEVSTGLIVHFNHPYIEVLASSNTQDNPFTAGEKTNIKSGRYCESVMLHRIPLQVDDAQRDPDWVHNVDLNLGMHSYLGYPLVWPDGSMFGTLCVQDRKEKSFSTLHKDLLLEFKGIIENDLRQLLFESEEGDNTLLALEKSEQKYRELVEEAATIILRWDVHGNISFFNEFAQRFFGFSEEEIIGNNVVGTIVPETEFTGRDLKILMQEICKDPTKFEYNENENIKRNGERVWIAWKNKPAFDDSGQLIEVLSVGIDITAHKKAEVALRESEERLSVLTSTTPAYICEINKNGIIQFANRTYEGVSMEQVVGSPLTDWFTEEQRPAITALVENVFVFAKNQSIEYEVADTEGNLRAFSTKITPVLTNEKVTSAVLTAMDITRRKQIEDTLDEQLRFERLLSELSAAFINIPAHKLDQEITRWLQTIVETLGINRSTIIQLSDEGKAARVTHSWATAGAHTAQIDLEPQGSMQWGIDKLRKGEIVTFAHVDDLPDCAEAYKKFLRAQGLKSSVLVPLMAGGVLLGALGYGTTKFERDWSKPLVQRLQLIGEVFTNALLRKRVEEDLHQAATVFDNTDEAIIITDAQKNIVATNKAFTDITGYSSQEVLGKSPRIQSSGRHAENFYDELTSSLDELGFWRGEIWNRRKNGEIYPAWENISAIRNAEGEITRYVSVFSDISSIKEAESRLNYLAHHDVLTGLPNRRLYMANLDQELERAKRHKEKVALLFLDLDRFKIINDTLGHSQGDRLLQTVAERLKKCVRGEDTVARIGGDEFTIIVSEISHAEDAVLIAEKIIESVAEPIQIDIQQVTTSTSVGISIYPDDSTNSEGLMKTADTAMYHAKERGGGTFAFYTSELTDKAFAHLAVEHGLRDALLKNELVVYYQPQVELKSGSIVGVEALVRWQHPEQELLGPDFFIPIAEETGLIDQLGEWVLRTACDEVRSWQRDGHSLRLAVNLSGRQLISQYGLETIWSLATELASQPGTPNLELEITESALQIAEHNLEALMQLKAAGVMLSIDDFGTGYSSLTRLKELPIDTLKIDRSFVHGIPMDADDNALVSATIAMAHRLGLKVIAEGVETQAQLSFLQDEYCDEVQGYLFSEPVPADQARILIEQHKKYI